MLSNETLHWRYRSARPLRQGGFGRTILAYDVLKGHEVLLKTAEGQDAGILRNEYIKLHRFRHSGIPAVYDFYRYDNKAILSMEYCSGETLAEHISRGKLPADRVFAILNDLASILSFIHRKGFVHGDLKPENIMLEESRLTLLDFGLSSKQGRPFGSGTVGTPAYSSPELLSGHGLMTQASDIYSLGLLAFEMLTGQLPRTEVRLNRSEPIIADINERVAGTGAGLLMKMLRYDPIERIATASELLTAGKESGLFARQEDFGKFEYAPSYGDLKRAMGLCQTSPATFVSLAGERGSGKSAFLNEVHYLNQVSGRNCYLVKGEILSGLDEDDLRFEPGAVVMADDADDSSERLSFLHRDRKCTIIAVSKNRGALLANSTSLNLSPCNTETYRRALRGCFPEMDSYDLGLLGNWMKEQTGNDIRRAEMMAGYLKTEGLISRKHGTWKVEWPAIYQYPGLPSDIRGTMEAWWEGLGNDDRKLAIDISLGKVDSEVDLGGSGLKYKTEERSQKWTIGDEQTLSYIAEKWTKEDGESFVALLKARRNNDLDFYRRPVYKETISKLDEGELWTKVARLLYERAENEKDLYRLLFLAKELLKNGKVSGDDKNIMIEKSAGIYCQLGDWNNALETWKMLETERGNQWDYWDRFLYMAINGRYFDMAAERAEFLANRVFPGTITSPLAKAYLGHIKVINGAQEHADVLIKSCLEESVANGDHDILFDVLGVAALTAYLKSDWEKVVDYWEKAGKTTPKGYRSHNLIRVNAAYGIALWRLGQTEKARDIYLDAIGMLGNEVPDIRLARMSYTLGLIYFDLRDWENAEKYFNLSLHHSLATGEISFLIAGMAGLGNVDLKRGKFSRAFRVTGEVYRMALKEGKEIIGHLVNLAMLENLLGQKELGLEHLAKAEAMAEKAKGFYQHSMILKAKASVEIEQENWAKAAEYYKAVLADGDAGQALGNSEIWSDLAVAEQMMGNIFQARIWLEKAEQDLKAGSPYGNQIKNAAGLIEMNEPDKRMEGMDKVIGAGKEMMKDGDRYQASKCWLQAAESALLHKDYDALSASMPWLLKAESEFIEMETPLMLARAQGAILKAARFYFSGQAPKAVPTDLLKGIYRLAEILSTEGNQSELAQSSLELAVKMSGAERGALFLLDDSGKISLAAQIDIDDQTQNDALEFSASAVLNSADRGDVIISNDASVDQAFNSRLSVRRNVIRSLLCVPIRFREGAAGAVYLDSRVTSGLFGKEQKEFVLALAGIIGSVLESSKLIGRLKLRQTEDKIKEDDLSSLIIGRSVPMQQMIDRIKSIAKADINVLLDGESGSGKEVVAQAIHRLSYRNREKFLALDCGSLPETLLESELFGYVKGAFTGANKDRTGLFESADRGTVFLDEIASASQAVQSRLLRVLENGEIRRVGEAESRTVDVRVICATNKDLEIEINEGRFREDLYYRLKVVTIPIPPLRERGSDILLLAELFKERYQKKFGKIGLKFSAEAKYQMMDYFWPGNVRELENTVQKAVLLTQNKMISPKELELSVEMITARDKKPETQKRALTEALEKCQGNISMAAKSLNISRRHFYRLMDKYKLRV